MMKKRAWSILLILCMVLSLLPFGVFAAGTAASGDYGDGLHWALSNDGTLTITGTGPMPDYASESLVMDENIDQQAPTPWLKHDGELRAVVIGEGITHVGDFTFFNDRKVTSVTLPSTLRSIGKSAFSMVPMEELTLPDSLQTIGAYAFSSCSMKRIVVPASVTDLGKYAFNNCREASVIKVLGPLNKLRELTFNDCYPMDLFLSKEIRAADDNVFGRDPHIRHIFYDGTEARFIDRISIYCVYLHTNVDLNIEPDFSDVPDGTWYTDSVNWAAERSFTTGTSATTFSPMQSCTRAQIVTFLWRYCGCPDVKNTANPFDDVKESDYFYQAVLWAVEKGITNGTTGHTFSPNKTVTRAETVTFFWRLRSKETPNERVKQFSDVPRTAYYAIAVDLAVANGLTNGISETEFGPNLPCTRAQIVTFLNRFTPRWWG